MSEPRFFAIVPAAGRSRRMGKSKLLLPWRHSTVIESLLAAWRASRVDQTVVVVHPDDDRLAEVCRAAGAQVVVPQEAPPDMKASVLVGLEWITQNYAPVDSDAWLLAPADMPTLSPSIINALIDHHLSEGAKVLVATYAKQRGHPVLFPCTLTPVVQQLRESEGINKLLSLCPVQEVIADCGSVIEDMDTPEEYELLRERDELRIRQTDKS